MLMTTHDTSTDAGVRPGVRGALALACVGAGRCGMNDHGRPSGPETMR